jgi:hypothetical protein
MTVKPNHRHVDVTVSHGRRCIRTCVVPAIGFDVCMYIVCVYICIYTHTHIHIHVCVCVYLYVCMHTHTHTHTHTHIYISMHGIAYVHV